MTRTMWEAQHLQSLDPRLWLGGRSWVYDGRRLGYSILLFYFFTESKK